MTVVEAVAAACGRVPPLWPLTHFVAVNPYVGMADLPFEQAGRLLHRTAHARHVMPASYYSEVLNEGRIASDDADALGLAPALQHAVQADAGNACHDGRLFSLAEWADLRDPESPGWSRFIVDEISKWCSSFFDEGQATWSMPWRERGLFAAWKAAAAHDLNPELMGLGRFRARIHLLPDDPLAVIGDAVNRLGVPEAIVDDYLLRLLMSVNGWSSYVQFRVRQATMADRISDELVQLLAVRIVYETALLDRGTRPDEDLDGWQRHLDALVSGPAGQPAEQDIRFAALAARERTWQRTLADAMANRGMLGDAAGARPDVQAVFCIDVRSEVFRRALESQSERVQTIGFAGFFGVPLAYRAGGSAQASARCPVLLSPSVPVSGPSAAGYVPSWLDDAWRSFRTSALSCFACVETTGLAFGATLLRELAAGIAWPGHEPRPRPLAAHDVALTLDERIALASGVLRGMGLTQTLAPLVLLCGHGSSTRNNPYASALDCGACGGHAGDVNARVAAALLNDPAVRAGLAAHGISVPADTLFVAGLHNTTTDDVTIEVNDEMRRTHGPQLDALGAWLVAASRQARRERAPALGLGSEPDARVDANVRRRSGDWSEVRPEWGLAGNAAFIAAPRSRTRGLDLGGRAFLQDYDSALDTDGAWLEQVMTAPMVVASWINLQYYASTVDNARFGSGTKVLHNVVGTFGVWEGNGGDLRVGLPWQSLHDGTTLRHEPMRLSVFIEASCAAIDAVLAKHRHVRELVRHGWIHMLAIEPRGRRCWRNTDGRWEPVRAGARETGRSDMGKAWYEAVDDFRRNAGGDGYPEALETCSRALFITCSESPEVTALIAALKPAAILQTLGGVVPSSADARLHASATDTIDDAVRRLSVSHVVLCGHAGCAGARDTGAFGLMKSMGIGHDDSQRHLLAQYRRLTDLLRAQAGEADIQLSALWFDRSDGGIWAYDQANQGFVPLDDADLERWVAHVSGVPAEACATE